MESDLVYHLPTAYQSPWDVACSKCQEPKHYKDGYSYAKGKRDTVCNDCKGTPRLATVRATKESPGAVTTSGKRYSGYRNPLVRYPDLITWICDLMSGVVELDSIVPWHYYGSKGGVLDWLIPLLEWPGVRHTFVDVYGGGGHVIYNRHPAAYEIYNDRDSLMVNLHRVTRNWPEEIHRRSIIKSWSRDEFAVASDHIKRWRALPEIERSRLLEPVGSKPPADYVDLAITDADLYLTALLCAEHMLTYLDQGYMSKTGSNSWEPHYEMTSGKTDNRTRMTRIFDVSTRMARVQMENMDALELIAKCRYSNCLLYCDPPYVPSSRRKASDYYHEMSEQDHVEFCELLMDHPGRAFVSGYHNSVYDEGYFTQKNGWFTFEKDVKFAFGNASDDVDQERTEVLWVNWNPGVSGKDNNQLVMV